MTHETTAPVQSLVDGILDDLENQADEYDSIHAGEGDLLRSAAELIRGQQALIAQQGAPVEVPDENGLLPCPFCGGKAELHQRETESLWSHNQVVWSQVVCRECDCVGEDCCEDDDGSEAAAYWNKRATLARPSAPGDTAAPETNESIAAGSYWANAEILGTESGWSVLEHAQWMKELLGLASEYLHDMPKNAVGRGDRAVELCRRLRLCLAGKAPGHLEDLPEETAAPERCSSCDGTGDVHRADGEWLGRCSCPAGAPEQAEQPTVEVTIRERWAEVESICWKIFEDGKKEFRGCTKERLEELRALLGGGK